VRLIVSHGALGAPGLLSGGRIRRAHATRRVQLPTLEAVPPELVRGADLIREPKAVHPPFLLGPPAAVPRELDDATLAVAFDDERPDEIRAARPSVNAQAIDGPFGVRVEQLVDEADHLDARNWPHQGDRGRFSALGERDDIGFETFGREGTLDDLGVYRHGRNISGVPWFLGVHAAPSRTKLTVGSAHVSREIPWLR